MIPDIVGIGILIAALRVDDLQTVSLWFRLAVIATICYAFYCIIRSALRQLKKLKK